MRSNALAVALSCTLLSGAAAATEPEPAMSAGDLQQLCQGEDHVSKNVCRVYILGVTQGIALGMSIIEHQPTGARPCVPAAVAAESLQQTVKMKLGAELAAHPGDRERDAAGFIGTVLASSYPCVKSNH